MACVDWSHWSHVAVSRVIPNLLDVRAGRVDLALAGEPAGYFTLLRRLGPLIAQPFGPRLRLYLTRPQCWADATGSTAVTTLFEPQAHAQARHLADPPRALLCFLMLETLEPDATLMTNIEAELAPLAGRGGLLVLPQPAALASRLAVAQAVLAQGWLPVFIAAPRGTKPLQAARSGPMALETERLARIIHELFLENAWTRGERHGSTPALHPWRQLDDTYRHANRSQAEHIACKLAWSGLIATAGARMADGSQEPLWSQPAFIEPLARLEHDRWASDRLLDGWVYGTPRDNAARRHPDLRPYESLSEEVREKDRVAVATIPFILQLAGLDWRPLLPVSLAGDWPALPARFRRRWRRDLARAAQERAPAILMFQLDAHAPEQGDWGRRLAQLGFPIALRLSGATPLAALMTTEATLSAWLEVVARCQQILWDTAEPPRLEAVMMREGLHIERRQ